MLVIHIFRRNMFMCTLELLVFVQYSCMLHLVGHFFGVLIQTNIVIIDVRHI